MPRLHRKLVKHYHEPGDLHELTFSCYRRLPLLTNDVWRTDLSRAIDHAMQTESMTLVAFVYMPEHIHLLVLPRTAEPKIDRLLSTIKQPLSAKIKAGLLAGQRRLLQRLTIRERPGKTAFRFWQEGPGYDRNLNTEPAVLAAIDYLHLNPVRRRLVREATTWRWSSARWYQSDCAVVDEALPQLGRIPAEFFSTIRQT